MTAVLLVAALLSSTAGCGADGGGPGESDAERPAATPLLPPRDPERPQVLAPDTALLGCASAGDLATRVVASVVLPTGYEVVARREPRRPEDPVACTLARVDGEGYRTPGATSFRLTLPAEGPPTGRAGPGVVTTERGGVLLSRTTPASATPAEAAEGRRHWEQVLASLAVRAEAAGDGDADAGSDSAPPDEDTTEVRALDPPPREVAGYTELPCDGGAGVVRALVPDRLGPLTGPVPCTWGRDGSGDLPLETITVEAGDLGSLWDVYVDARADEDQGGDDDTGDLEYDNDVPGPGGLSGESLVVTSSNDGRALEVHHLQAGGVRLSWSVRPDAWGPQLDEMRTVLDSVALDLD